jgi:hypothetical protein
MKVKGIGRRPNFTELAKKGGTNCARHFHEIEIHTQKIIVYQEKIMANRVGKPGMDTRHD